jgi:hypothetical protein
VKCLLKEVTVTVTGRVFIGLAGVTLLLPLFILNVDNDLQLKELRYSTVKATFESHSECFNCDTLYHQSYLPRKVHIFNFIHEFFSFFSSDNSTNSHRKNIISMAA